MAKKQIELELKVQGAQTLRQLEDNLAEINEQLKGVDINSKAFADLSKQAQAATAALEKVNSQIDGVTSVQKAEAAVKLGEGLVGGFAAAQSAAALFGSESSEAIQAAANQAVLLFTALDGLKKVTEAFSAENIKGYKAILDGIKKSTLATKLFGTTTKAALAATGIGLLIIAVGLLIANWDTVTGAVVKFKDQLITALKFIAPPLGFLIAGIDTLVERFGSLTAVASGFAAVLKSILTLNFSNLSETFTEAAESSQELKENTEKLVELSTTINKQNERKIALLTAQGNKENEIFEIKRKQLEEQIKLVKATGDENDELDDLQNNLKILNIQENNRLLQVQKTRLERQRAANEDRENIRKEQLAAVEGIENLIVRVRALRVINSLNNALSVVKDFNSELDDQAVENIKEQSILLLQQRKNIEDQTKAQKEFNEASARQGDGIDFSGEVVNGKLIKLQVDSKLESEEKLLKLKIEGVNIEEKLLSLSEKQNRINNNIKIKDLINANEEERLKIQQAQLFISEENAKTDRAEFILIQRLNQLKLQSLKLDKKEIEEQLKLNLSAEEEFNLKEQLININNQIIGTTREIGREYDGVNEKFLDGNNIIRDSIEQFKLLRKEIREYGTDSEQAALKLENIANAIQIIGDAAAIAFEFQLVALDNQLNGLNKRYDQATERLEEFYDTQEKFQSSDIDFNELLREANGDRFNEIAAAQKAEKAREEAFRNESAIQENELFKSQIDAQNQLNDAEYKIERTRKQQQVVQAIIAAALAVTRALPNIPLSIVAGLLGGAQVALISSQEIPKPEAIPYPQGFADGGYTGDGSKNQVAGIVHSGEYVVPQKVLATQDGAQMANTLEAMRLGFKGYADGGNVTPSTPDSVSSSINQSQEFVKALENAKIYVSVQEINDVNTNVQVIEQKASI